MNAPRVRGVRGAIAVDADTAEAIAAATQRLLRAMLERNRLDLDDVASALFSLTPDLRAAFPAHAARAIGWSHVPMLHCTEVDVPGALPRCIRVLLHVTTALRPDEIAHVYLDGAAVLRPDLTGAQA